MSEYEKQRQLNIQKNIELLTAMGLNKPFFEKQPKAKPAAKKRKPKANNDESLEAPAPKIPRTDSTNVADAGVRRSARHAGKTVDYSGEQQHSVPIPLSFKSGVRRTDNAGPLGRESGKRMHDPSVTLFTYLRSVSCHKLGKHMDLFLVSKWGHGGKPDKDAVPMPFTR
jgi:E3 ubiquitin-protein ligase UHRF1